MALFGKIRRNGRYNSRLIENYSNKIKADLPLKFCHRVRPALVCSGKLDDRLPYCMCLSNGPPCGDRNQRRDTSLHKQSIGFLPCGKKPPNLTIGNREKDTRMGARFMNLVFNERRRWEFHQRNGRDTRHTRPLEPRRTKLISSIGKWNGNSWRSVRG
jgi:hypothetical protein